jgi:hypothetical protein
MKTAYDISPDELADLVDSIQRFVYGRYRIVGGREIDFLDRDKPFSSDVIDSITLALDEYDLVPEIGLSRLESESEALHVCDGCSFAFEASALLPLGHADTADATAKVGEPEATGRCPRCKRFCRPIPAAALIER